MSKSTETMEKIVALCRRRGFIFGSSEIYGGIGGFWDYGPLGCELKRNIKDAWWNDMVRNPPIGPGGREYQMVGVDCSIIMNPQVWVASGHVGGFSDPMVDDKETKQRFRADQLFGIYLDCHQSFVESHNVAVFGTEVRGSGEVEFESLRKQRLPNHTVLASSAGEAAGIFLSDKSARKVAGLKALSNDVQKGGSDAYTFDFGKGPEPGYIWPVFRELLDKYADKIPSPFTGKIGSLTPPRAFNLMFQTHVGALQDASSVAYLRPETAQGIFVNFKNVMDSTRVKIPFGIAQMGKAFRNEINPRNYTFRSREFEQMEIEFFCHPTESRMWYEFWRDVRKGWYESLNIKSDKLRPREQGKEELAHYSCGTTDIEYLFPFSDEPQELEGVAHRGDFDLKAHGKHAKGDENAFAVFDDERWEEDKGKFSPEEAKAVKSKPPYNFVPHVIEPSAGVDRFALATICEAYSFDESRASPEFMKFHPRLAPIKAAVFPLVAKDGLPEIAEPIYREIKKHFPCQYDAKQSIGKRYARMDEAGTPFCFTIDGQSKEDGTITVRNRDDASQVRIDKSRCVQYLHDQLKL